MTNPTPPPWTPLSNFPHGTLLLCSAFIEPPEQLQAIDPRDSVPD